MDLVVKKYDTGKVSKAIHSLSVGDKLDMKGPFTKFNYTKNTHDEISMVAGGSGITPMYQVIKRILRDPQDKTRVTLLFANKSKNDIILSDELDALAQQHPEQFKVVYVLDGVKKGEEWHGKVGYVDEAMLKQVLPRAENGKVFVCGPPGMMKLVSGPKGEKGAQGELGGLLKQMGWTQEKVFKF